MSNVDTSTFQIRRIYQKTKTKQIISRKLLKRIYYFGYKYSSKTNLISKLFTFKIQLQNDNAI